MSRIKLFNKLFNYFSSNIAVRESNYNYYSSREDYYHSILRDDSLTRLSMLLKEHIHAPNNPEIDIRFRNIAFNTFINQVVKKLGKPRFTIDNKAYVKGHKILFYRFKIDKYKTVAQLHFLNGFFFYGKYTFKNINQADSLKINSILKSKYFFLPETENTFSRVKDQHNNVISVEKSMYLNIKYISGLPEFSEQVGKLFMNHLEKRKEKENIKIASLRDSL